MNASCIAVVNVGGSEFWNEVKNGARKASKELKLNLYIRGAVDEINVKGQKRVINDAINKGCKGFVIAPNSTQINGIVSQLKLKNIPTVYIDRDYIGDRVSIVSTNNYKAGQLAAQEIIKALKGQGNVALFRLSKDVVSTTNRERGFIDELEKSDIKIILDKYIGTRVGNARRNSFTWLKRMQNIDAIFTPNETTSLAVLKNLKTLNKAGKVLHIGFDAHGLMIEALQSNMIYGFVVQQPFEMGYKAVYTLNDAMNNRRINSKIDTNVLFIDKNNINEIKIQKVLGLNKK